MYPLFLKLIDKPCLVIGGGTIAERKTISLLEAGALVTLISPDITGELKSLVDTGLVNYKKRLYRDGDTQNFFLIIAATNSRRCNEQVYNDGLKCNALINCVDDPEFCNFYVPALVTRGSLKIAISTEGKLPMLAGKIRKFLNSLFPEDIGENLDKLGILRRRIMSEAGDDEQKKKAMFREKLAPHIDLIMEEIEK